VIIHRNKIKEVSIEIPSNNGTVKPRPKTIKIEKLSTANSQKTAIGTNSITSRGKIPQKYKSPKIIIIEISKVERTESPSTRFYSNDLVRRNP